MRLRRPQTGLSVLFLGGAGLQPCHQTLPLQVGFSR